MSNDGPIATGRACHVAMGVLTVLMLTSNANALELPSEVDLRAAYCIPIAQHTLNWLMSAAKNEQYAELKATVEEGISEWTADLRRLQLYLIPRIPHLDLLGLEAARKRGEEDIVRRDEVSKACMAKCNDLKSSKWRTCLDKCNDNSLMTRMKACSDLRWLPF